MAETSTLVMPEANVTSLKEALCAQQLLLQQLYNELDEEREASATAASEALSMILRLQGEKASLKMEASQYKRMAEEKICHAEEALAMFEDLIYQRELEIVSLEFQVQAYRHRLLSMGCNDLGVYENKFPENLLVQRPETVFGEKGANGTIRMLNSLPQFLTKDPSKRSSIERKRPVTPKLDSITRNVAECTMQEVNWLEKGSESSSDIEINAYREQIKKMDGKVKEISDSRESVRNKSTIWKSSTWSPALFSQAIGGSFTDPIKALDVSGSDHVKNSETSQESETSADPASLTTSVQDIFEVPQVAEVMERHKGVEKPDSDSADTVKLCRNNDTGRLKKPLHSAFRELKVPKPQQGMSIEHGVSPVQRELGAMESKIEYQHLIRRIERLEGARPTVKQEIVGGGEEEMNLLKEIHEQLKSIQAEMRKWKAKKPPLRNDTAVLDPLREAMVYFWL